MNIQQDTRCINLRRHSGSSPDQLPYTRQVRSLLPRYCLKPSLQLMVITFPDSVPVSFTVPSSGTLGTPHPRQKVDTWAWWYRGKEDVRHFIWPILISTTWWKLLIWGIEWRSKIKLVRKRIVHHSSLWQPFISAPLPSFCVLLFLVWVLMEMVCKRQANPYFTVVPKKSVKSMYMQSSNSDSFTWWFFPSVVVQQCKTNAEVALTQSLALTSTWPLMPHWKSGQPTRDPIYRSQRVKVLKIWPGESSSAHTLTSVNWPTKLSWGL